MHCEPERWDVSEPLTPELIETYAKQARKLRSEAMPELLRAFGRLLTRRRSTHPERKLYARLATWSH